MLLQLKASDSFVSLVSRAKRVSALVLCEGHRDAEVFKQVAQRLGFTETLAEKGLSVAVTDAEGLNTLRKELLPAILSLIIGKVISRPKPVGVIVDADDQSPGQRAKSIRDSLASRGHETSITRACSQVWELKVKHEDWETPVLVAVNGLPEAPELQSLEKHSIEDHIALLKILEGHLAPEDAAKARKPKELVNEADLELLRQANTDHLRRAFSHIDCLLKNLQAHLARGA